MPILLDVPGMFVAGSAVALVSRRRISSTRAGGISRHVKTAVVFGALYGLTTSVLSFWREDWMWSYLVRPPLPTMAWYLGFWAMLASLCGLGAWVTQRELRHGRTRTAWAIFGIALAALLGVWAAALRAYLHVGTYGEYHEDLAFHLDEMPETGQILVVSTAINAAAFLAILGINRWVDWRRRRRAVAH